jgi:uncharacterized protein
MRSFYIAILSFFLPAIGFSQAKTSAKKNNAPVQKLANTVLWEITGKGLKTPSYLFGTMHILCAQDAKISDTLQAAIDKSEVIYFEVDMDNTAELMGLFKYIRMKDNKKLSDLMTAEEYERVKTYFSESKMPCETKNGMEEVIMQEVKKQQKPINGLESIAFQASVFDSIPYTEQARELLQTIDSSDKEDSSTLRMLEVYRSQDLDAIEQLTAQEEGLSAYLDLFLYHRNAKWIPTIEAAIQKSPTLIAVGAAHLPGTKGLIQLLVKAGYQLRPMKHSIHQKTM